MHAWCAVQVHVRRAEGLALPKDSKGKAVALNPQIMVSVGPSCGACTCAPDPTCSLRHGISTLLKMPRA